MTQKMQKKPNAELTFREFVERKWKLWLVESGLPAESHGKFFQWGPFFHEVDADYKTLDNGEMIFKGMSVTIFFQSTAASKVMFSETNHNTPLMIFCGKEVGGGDLSSVDRFLFDAVDGCPLYPGFETSRKDFRFCLDYATGNASVKVVARENNVTKD